VLELIFAAQVPYWDYLQPVGGLKWHWAFVRLQEQIVGFTIPVILRAT
jgi:hypothetical protein